jgi:hypothetical protein
MLSELATFAVLSAVEVKAKVIGREAFPTARSRAAAVAVAVTAAVPAKTKEPLRLLGLAEVMV